MMGVKKIFYTLFGKPYIDARIQSSVDAQFQVNIEHNQNLITYLDNLYRNIGRDDYNFGWADSDKIIYFLSDLLAEMTSKPPPDMIDDEQKALDMVPRFGDDLGAKKVDIGIVRR